MVFILNYIVCEVGHFLMFVVEFTWLSEVMGPYLEITLVDLIGVYE